MKMIFCRFWALKNISLAIRFLAAEEWDQKWLKLKHIDQKQYN